MDEARSYLLAPHSGFWRWDDDGEVVTWTDGTAIAFRYELATVCRDLAPQGLPPLGSILLLMAAMRQNWRESSAEPEILVGILDCESYADTARSVLAEILGGLDKISYVCDELGRQPQTKQAIAEAVFEGRRGRTAPETAAAVIELLESPLEEAIVHPLRLRRQPVYGPDQLLKDLSFLRWGVAEVDAGAIALRMRTGLDDVPQQADLDLPPAARVRALLASLQNDDELHGLARVAQRLMAAVTLPRKIADRDDLPIGGVSDITNRGPLDRLLLSELAHDDLTLAVRVAVNEALYLRRESPPRTPPQNRHLLLETGIRSWGAPRVFSAAVALALAATADATIDCLAFRADGASVQPVDLTTRAGLVAHLEALTSALHPGDALPAFDRELESSEHAAEPVLVTTDDVLDDPEFQRALAEHLGFPLLIAAVNRDGGFRLLERTAHGQKLLRQAALDLDELFARPHRPAARLIDKSRGRDLPAICSVEPFPLLLSHSIDPAATWRAAGHGVLSLASDRRLMLWTANDRGAAQITDTAPAGVIHWRSPVVVGDRASLVVGPRSRRRLHLLHVDLKHGRCEQLPLQTGDEPVGVCAHNGALFLIGRGFVDVLGSRGDRIQRLELPKEVVWMRDRFFRGSFTCRWFALSFDGRSAVLETVVEEGKHRRPKLLTMFERHDDLFRIGAVPPPQAIEGPIGVTANGDLYFTATETLCKVEHGFGADIALMAISADGSRLVLCRKSDPGGRHHFIEVLFSSFVRSQQCYGDPIANVEGYGALVRPVNLRHRLLNIFVDHDDKLTLTTRKGQRLRLVFDEAQQQIVLEPVDSSRVASRGFRTFKPVVTPREIGYRLSVATWDDGSQAFLDTRGLLHLRSSDSGRIPETTIVLAHRVLSGWCADGRLWGSSYFIGDERGASPQLVYETAIRAFTRRLA